METGELVLIRAVVIHRPDFLIASGASTYECNLRGGNPRQSAGKFHDDFIGKLVREKAHLGVGNFSAINLGYHGRGRRVAHVVEPRLNREAVATCIQISECHRLRRSRRISPCLCLEFGRLAGQLKRIHAGTYQINDSTEIKIGADDVAELFAERLRRWIGSGEIGDSDAGF